jgi:hypothetical protein
VREFEVGRSSGLKEWSIEDWRCEWDDGFFDGLRWTYVYSFLQGECVDILS